MRKRYKHSLSHYKLLTMDMGYLIPLTWYDVLPGDTIQQNSSCLIRCSPLLAPVMHPVHVRIHHWFVPLRLIWEDFEDFITGGPDGTDSTEPPYRAQAVTEGSLQDYLGIPVGWGGGSNKYSALPIRAYNLIFNEFYRDQDLVTALSCPTGSGSTTTTEPTDIQSVSWEKDYLTTCRTTPQKGDEIYIPLYDESVPVTGDGGGTINFNDGASRDMYLKVTSGSATPGWDNASTGATGAALLGTTADPTDSGLEVDLTSVTGIPISDLRLSIAMQRFMENRSNYGSRYHEYLRSLGVKSKDGRLDMPEYLGGGRQTISFSEVLSSDGANTGEMYGHGIAAIRTNRFRRFMEEHGIVMTMMSVVPKAIYSQGLHKRFFREVKEDFFQPELTNIGEQEVYNKEVYVAHTNPENVFGYQAQYDEYRSIPSGIAGEFHSTNDHWHYARIFSSDPALNSTFVTCTPTKRVNASTNTDCLYVMSNHSIQARRLVPSVARTSIK